MGFLAVDVTSYGVVMSADSQRVDILPGENRLFTRTWEKRNPIVQRVGGGFVGLVGFAGTEQVAGTPTAEWLRRFISTSTDADIETFCGALGDALTDVWRAERMSSVLEVLVTGEVSGDPQFWYVRNSAGVDPSGLFYPPADDFEVMNDLDVNYIPRDARPGEHKADVLRRRTYSFMQGVLLPSSPVFLGFGQLMTTLYSARIDGLDPVSSLDDVGQYARVRMEFLKRLCSAKHGIWAEGRPSPIGGDVHVFGVTTDGAIREYSKHAVQVKDVRPGRGGLQRRSGTG